MDLVSRAFAPDAIVTQVASRADVHPSQPYRWRAKLGNELPAGELGFARFVVGDDIVGALKPRAPVKLTGIYSDFEDRAPTQLR